jgi:hypothetical protein
VAGDLIPIEDRLRAGEMLDPDAHLVMRGWPVDVAGILRNADLTRSRYSRAGEPFVAISAEVTIAGWDVDSILKGPRLRSRRTYAIAPVHDVLEAGFDLLPTFNAPHYSVVLPSYTEAIAALLVEAFGEVKPNPHFERR